MDGRVKPKYNIEYLILLQTSIISCLFLEKFNCRGIVRWECGAAFTGGRGTRRGERPAGPKAFYSCRDRPLSGDLGTQTQNQWISARHPNTEPTFLSDLHKNYCVLYLLFHEGFNAPKVSTFDACYIMTTPTFAKISVFKLIIPQQVRHSLGLASSVLPISGWIQRSRHQHVKSFQFHENFNVTKINMFGPSWFTKNITLQRSSC